MSTEHDYDLNKKIKITFQGMDYFVMPRYTEHYLNHDYEKFSLQILKNNLNKNSLFVDVGAHYGAYSLYAAKEAKSKVIALEPVSENFQLLNENVQINKLDGLIQTYNYAVSDTDGEAVFNIPWASDSAGFYEHPNAHTIRKQKVIVRRGDNIVGSKRVDMIKIDTEGHELMVLKGLGKTLRANPDAQLIIEINSPLLESAGTNAMSLLQAIKDLKKEIYMIDEDGFTMHRITDRLDKWPLYINEGNYANLYCVPAKGHQYLMFVSHSSELGGAEMAMFEQICELRERGILAHVILPGPGPLQALLIEKAIGHNIVDGYSFWISQEGLAAKHPDANRQRNFNNMNAALDITAIAEAINPTAVVNNTVVNPWGYPAARSGGLPLIWMVHEYGDLDHGLLFSHGATVTRNFIVNNSELVICCSDAIKHSLPVGSSNQNKIYTVYNLMHPDRIVELSQASIEPPFSTGKAVKLCVVGNVSEGKGQAWVIEAASILKEQSKKVEVILLGSSNPDYEKHLKQKIKASNVADQVKFLGFIDNPYPYIKVSDAVVVASRDEAFGRVTAEAMILGVPVIASDRGGSLEMVKDGKTGFLFKSSDAQDLADKIRMFADTPKDKLTPMIKNAGDNIRNLLDTKKNADKLAELISKAALSPSAAADKKPMTSEWLDTIRVYRRKLEQAKAKNRQILEQAQGQKQINLELAETLRDIQGSRAYKVGRMLADIKNKLKGQK